MFRAFFLPLMALAFSIGSLTVALPELEPVEPPSNEADNVDVPGKISVTVLKATWLELKIFLGQAAPPGAEKPNDDDVSEGWNMFFGTKSGTFIHGFIATLSVILVSELGDKTFFIGTI